MKNVCTRRSTDMYTPGADRRPGHQAGERNDRTLADDIRQIMLVGDVVGRWCLPACRRARIARRAGVFSRVSIADAGWQDQTSAGGAE
jgi:hypothetical protein